MKTGFRLKSVAVAMAVLVFSASAWSAKPVDSLNDLPAKWEGIGGNLFERVQATWTIDRITKVDRQDTPQEVISTYSVDSKLVLGGRSVGITSVRLLVYPKLGREIYLTLGTDDELFPFISTSITYDEASDSYTLFENSQGTSAHRFILKGRK